MPPKFQPLFSNGDARDRAYVNLRDLTSDWIVKGRRFTEELWAEYYQHADEQFLADIRADFHARFWEMYLTCALKQCDAKRGYDTSCPKGKLGGPDILLRREGKRIWIEATTATDGSPDKPDSLVEPTSGQVHTIPEEKILLRYTQAISEKRSKCLLYRKKILWQMGIPLL